MTRKMVRSMSLLLVTFMIIVMISGCGGATSTTTTNTTTTAKATTTGSVSPSTKAMKDLYIVYVAEGTNMSFQKMCLDQFVVYAKELGIKYKTLDAEMDAAKQLSILDAVILEKPDALIIVPATGVEPGIKRFNEAKIPVVCIDHEPLDVVANKDLKYNFVGADNFGMGVSWATYLAAQLPKDSKICYLWSRFGAQTHILRHQGFIDTIYQLRKDVRVIDEQQSMANAANAMAITEDWIKRFGKDGINAIVSSAGQAAQGSMEVLINNGLTEKIFICAPDLLSVKNIMSGGIDCDLFQDDKLFARTAVDTALKLIKGEPAEKTQLVKCEVITKENAQKYSALRP